MNENTIREVSEKVKQCGVVTIQNFLNLKNLELAKKAIKDVKTESIEKGDVMGHYPVSIKSQLIKLCKLDFKSVKSASKLKKIAEDLRLEKIAKNFFESNVELHMIDSYFSPKSDKNILGWHSDMSYNQAYNTYNPKKKYDVNLASLKFFFYMTDVQSDNGCLAYIPYSNMITKTLIQLILNKKIKPRFFWSLEELRNHVKSHDVKNLISEIVGNKKLEAFLDYSKFIESEKKDTFEFDFEMKKGGVVIFDEFGVHRGSKPSKNDRLVLRFFYRKKK